MERMVRTAQTGAATRVTPMRPRGIRSMDDHTVPDVPVWDVMDVPASTIEALRSEVEVLRARLAQTAPRRAIVEMDRAICLLNRRVEDIREAGAAGRDGREELLLRELGELKAGVAALARPERVRALESGLDALSRKIDLMGAKAVDPVEVARLHGQLAELKDLVGRAVSAAAVPGGLSKLAERLATCAEDIARAGEDTARRLAEATSRFERNAVALLERVENLQARARIGDAAAAEDLKLSLLAVLETVHRRLDQVSDQVSRQVVALSPAIGAELTQRLDLLLQRISAAEEAGKLAIAPLADVVERHLLALTEQFRDAHARLGRLDTIEISIQRMAEEMRQVRETTHSATSEAVRAVTAKVSTDPDGVAVVGLKRGLAALEARQDEIERRASEILVNDLELELNDIAVALDRDANGAYAPRAAGKQPHAAAPEMHEPEPEPVAAAPTHPAPASPEAPPASTETPWPGEAPRVGEMPWPRAGRRAPWEQAEHADGADPRPRMGERKIPKRQELKKPEARRHDSKREHRILRGDFFRRHRHVAMVALIAGATTVFAGTAVGLAWRNGPELISGVTSAVRRLAAPAVTGVSGTDLPAPMGTPALQSAARAGDPAAAFVVAGRFADDGELDSAVKWLAFAMAQGSAPAAHRLGVLYEAGGRDIGEARRFYEWAAQQGNVRAMHALAMLLSDGRTAGAGGKPDWEGAVRWFRAAAELGHRDSQYNLGVVYARGLGVSADLGEAWKWLNLAAAQGDDDSAKKRDIIARDTDAATLARAQQASAVFVPVTPNPSANMVDLRPEWTDGADTQGMAGSTAPATDKGLLLASNQPAAPLSAAPQARPPAASPQAAGAQMAGAQMASTKPASRPSSTK